MQRCPDAIHICLGNSLTSVIAPATQASIFCNFSLINVASKLPLTHSKSETVPTARFSSGNDYRFHMTPERFNQVEQSGIYQPGFTGEQRSDANVG